MARTKQSKRTAFYSKFLSLFSASGFVRHPSGLTPGEPLEVTCNSVMDVLRAIEEKPIKNVRFLVPVERVCMHGTFRYSDGWHPFMEFLKVGDQALRDFYAEFQPKNIGDMYGLMTDDPAAKSLPPWALPWLGVDNSSAPSAEKGLALSNGVSYFGPASEEKVQLESERLRSVRDSISQFGYSPDQHGDITGWFLVEEENFVFFVRGGKHRAAGLADLGRKYITVRVRDRQQPILSLSNIRAWKAVESGDMSESLAKLVFREYISNNGMQQIRGRVTID